MTLKETREAAGLTQRDLAKLARVCRASVSHIENGRYAPTARFAGKICRALSGALGCSLHTWQLFPEYFTRLDFPPEAPPAEPATPTTPAPAPAVRKSGVRA